MRVIQTFCARVANRVIGPWLPDRRRLGFDYRIHMLRSADPELKHLDRLGPNRGIAIDAGANVGIFTYRLAGLYEKVHSFEICPSLAERLRSLAPANVMVHASGLSSSEGKGTLRIPVFGGRRQYAWATLGSGNFTGAERCDEMPVEFRPLDSFALTGVTMLKVDVEGHEVELFKGAMETLRRNRPHVFVEVNQDNIAAVRELFAALGYEERSLAQVIGPACASSNYHFVPR